MANRTRTSSRPTKGGTAQAPPKAAPPKISATVKGGVAGANRKERKEEARRQREALQRKIARRRYYRMGTMVAAAVVVLALVLAFTVFKGKSSPAASGTSYDQSKLPGLMTTTATSQWVANQADLGARVNMMGLPPLAASESLQYHIHQELQIFVDGKQVAIPAFIGIDQASSQIAIIHVHAEDGVIHVESPIKRVYTLGHFFGVWGLNFTPTSIGGYQNGGGKTLQVFLNGKPYPGNPTKLPLKEHEIIVVAFGTSSELPNPIPHTFDWANSSAG